MPIPPLDELLHKVPSKYALAVLAAKRARTLTEGQFGNIYPRGTKPVTVALQEIGKGKIGYEWIRKRREPDRG